MADRLVGQAAPGLYKAIADDGQDSSPDLAVFPIVSQDPHGTFIAIGTGFFIGPSGLFVTAAHVVREMLGADNKATGPFGLFQFLPERGYVVRPIAVTRLHATSDLAVGLARPMTRSTDGTPLLNRRLRLAERAPAVGESCCTFAFPRTEVSPGKPQVIRFRPGFFEGHVRAHHPVQRDSVMMPWPCFETSMVLHGASSGGPVFNEAGHVFAVNTSSYGADPTSFVSCIQGILDMSLDNVSIAGETAPRQVGLRELSELGVIDRA